MPTCFNDNMNIMAYIGQKIKGEWEWVVWHNISDGGTKFSGDWIILGYKCQ